jgi:lipoprotein-releasing system permease protein
MVILDKRAHLKTLFAMGLEIPQLRRIYFFQGFLLSALGGLIGVIIASLVLGAQLLFGFVKIGMELSYPVAFSLENFILVLGTIFVLGALAAYVASIRINKNLMG